MLVFSLSVVGSTICAFILHELCPNTCEPCEPWCAFHVRLALLLTFIAGRRGGGGHCRIRHTIGHRRCPPPRPWWRRRRVLLAIAEETQSMPQYRGACCCYRPRWSGRAHRPARTCQPAQVRRLPVVVLVFLAVFPSRVRSAPLARPRSSTRPWLPQARCLTAISSWKNTDNAFLIGDK